MTIEENIFKRAKVNFNKLGEYGFKKDKTFYRYSKNILNNSFRIDIEVNNNGIINGRVYDLSFNNEYSNFRVEDARGTFVKKVRDEYINLLLNIKNNCFTEELFMFDQSNRIVKAIKEKYQDAPQFQWEKFPLYATFKNKDSKKWYAIIMNVDKSKLDKTSTGIVEIINVKLDPIKIELLLNQQGFSLAYHMNKKNWITIILDNTLEDEYIMNLLDESYSYTLNK